MAIGASLPAFVPIGFAHIFFFTAQRVVNLPIVSVFSPNCIARSAPYDAKRYS